MAIQPLQNNQGNASPAPHRAAMFLRCITQYNEKSKSRQKNFQRAIKLGKVYWWVRHVSDHENLIFDG